MPFCDEISNRNFILFSTWLLIIIINFIQTAKGYTKGLEPVQGGPQQKIL